MFAIIIESKKVAFLIWKLAVANNLTKVYTP